MATAALPHFRRPHHQSIAKLLQAFDSDLLLKAECYFGGGTAIALSLDEYRESVDIDFLCSSQEGFRTLRNTVNADLGPLLRFPIKHARGITSNQGKIMTVLEIDDIKVKVELLREGNTKLSGSMDPVLGIPILSRTDLWAQKLMANSDRALDKSTMSRDIIDLAMMLRRWGPLPQDAFKKAHDAYGESLTRGFNNAIGIISESKYLKNSMNSMGMDLSLVDEIFMVLDDASAALPLNPVEKAESDRRIAMLSKLEDSAGTAFIFWKAASTAIKASPDSRVTNWAQVERDAIHDAVVAHGHDANEIVNVIAKFSPAAASATRMKAVEARVFQQVPQLQSTHREEQYRKAENSAPD